MKHRPKLFTNSTPIVKTVGRLTPTDSSQLGRSWQKAHSRSKNTSSRVTARPQDGLRDGWSTTRAWRIMPKASAWLTRPTSTGFCQLVEPAI